MEPRRASRRIHHLPFFRIRDPSTKLRLVVQSSSRLSFSPLVDASFELTFYPSSFFEYCYLLSAALDTGTIFSVLAILLCLQLSKNGALALNWRRNLVFLNSESRCLSPLSPSLRN